MDENIKPEEAANDELSKEIIDEALEECEKDEAGTNTEGSAADETKKDETAKKPDDELEKAKAKADEYLDKYQRLMAEFVNFRDRTSREKAGMYNDGLRDTIEKLLPVIDNLERAVNTQRDKAEADDSFFKGVDMILKQFKEILKAIGVEEIAAVGEKFDPKLHSAVSHIDDENLGENTISVEMLKGYKMGDKVIRHSMVQVAN